MRNNLDLSSIEHSFHSDFSQETAEDSRFVIKRKGARPIRFEGLEIAMSMSFSAKLSYWYEVNLYKTSEYRYVSAVRLFHQSSDLADTVVAEEHDNLDIAVQFLVEYDAAQDVQVTSNSDFSSEIPAELAATALSLISRIHEMRTHYRALVGEFLFEHENITS